MRGTLALAPGVLEDPDRDSLKVNDAVGNPIEIAAVIDWQVVDSFRALFEVDRYEDLVHLQTEAAIRLTLQHELQQRPRPAGRVRVWSSL